jgi:hypothetical protein
MKDMSSQTENSIRPRSRRDWRLPTVIATLHLVLAGCCCSAVGLFAVFAVSRHTDLRDFNRTHEARSQVWIVWQTDRNMFPAAMRQPPISMRAIALDRQEADRSVAIVVQGLDKYPASLLQSTLRRIYVVNTLIMGGNMVGGTYSQSPGDSRVYLANGGTDQGYTDFFIERAFHEEYSSILMKSFPEAWSDADWEQVNPEGFQYGYDVATGYRTTGNPAYDPALYDLGFISQYSETLLENDFNAIASRLLVGDPKLWEVASTHERIRRKVDLAIAFYGQLDPQFTEAYFRSLIISDTSQ